MPCTGCLRRKAKLKRGVQMARRWIRKTPALAKAAIVRRIQMRRDVV
jgi:hypothetical protein